MSASETSHFGDAEVRCLRGLRAGRLQKNLVRVMLLAVKEPEKVLARLQQQGLVSEDEDSWGLTPDGERQADEIIEEIERAKAATPDQVGYVGYGRRVHLLRMSTRKDRGDRGPYYAVCGADSPKSATHPFAAVDDGKPMEKQIDCPSCLRIANAKS